MIDLERRLGPLSLRAWGLVANFVFNGVALWGLSHLLRGEGGLAPLVIGVGGTLGCLALVAIPSREDG